MVGSRSSEFTSTLAAWGPYNGSTVSLTNRPGYARVTVSTNNFDGLIVSGGVLVNEFPPPWHFEIAFERPTNVNTAIGLLLPADAVALGDDIGRLDGGGKALETARAYHAKA